MKRCPKCGETKLLEDFYADRRTRDDHTCWCKVCHKEHAASYRLTPGGRAAHQRGNAVSRIRFPEKIEAWNQLNNSVQSGKLKRPCRCDKCGKRRKTQAHHPDYSKPLAVVWLCTPYHNTEHKENHESFTR